MKLIADKKAIWSHYSTWALGTITGLGGVWANIPDAVKNDLPIWAHHAVSWTIVVTAILGIGSKFVAQNPSAEEEKSI